MKKYILYFGHFELPDKNALAHRVLANAELLRAIGYDVVLVAYSRDSNNFSVLSTRYQYKNYTCYSIPYPQTMMAWVKDGKSYKSVLQVIKYHGIEHCAAIIFTGVGIGNTNGIIGISKKYKIPIISDTVDWFKHKNGNVFIRFVKNAIEEYMGRFLKPRVRNIICISTYLQKYYDSRKCNTCIIPSLTYADDPRFKTKALYIPSPDIKFCYTGNPGYKGSKDRVDWCVRAFAETCCTNASLKVYGITEEDFSSQFPDVYALAKGKSVEFFGIRPNRECIAAIAQSDFFTFAREDTQITRAGFPTKLSESLALGTPIVTTPSGDVTHYLSNGKNGFISFSCNYEDYQKAFRQAFLTTKTQRAAMREFCLKGSPLDESKWHEVFRQYLADI